MVDLPHILMDSAETSRLWQTYMFETLNKCILKHFQATVEDNDILSIINEFLKSEEARIQIMKEVFIKEQFPVPLGFTDQDINLNAPRLFTDKVMVDYLLFMARMAIYEYNLSFSIAPRADIRKFFTDALIFHIQVEKRIIDIC